MYLYTSSIMIYLLTISTTLNVRFKVKIFLFLVTHRGLPIPNLARSIAKTNDKEQAKYYYETIEGYKLVVENKNKQIENLQKELETAINAKEFLKKELATQEEHMKWMESLISKKQK